MTQKHINIENVIACLESDLEYYLLKYDSARDMQDQYYYLGLLKGTENALSTIKSHMP